MFKTNMCVQLSNLFVQSRHLTDKLNTEVEISVWGFVGIIVLGAAVGIGLSALVHWLIDR
jgi:hypothetical protein